MYDKNWYNLLDKSSLNPPPWVFGIVWPILYSLMYLSLFIILNNKKCQPYCKPIDFFILQLLFNLQWTNVFFIKKKIKTALIYTTIIIIFTIITIISFYNINKIASFLLIPYLLWLFFAFYLNLYIVLNN